MGIFGNKEEETFYPNCRPTEGSSEGRVVLECQPKLERPDGKVLHGERPATIVIEQGQQAVVTDDGGIAEPVLNRLLEHIESKRMG